MHLLLDKGMDRATRRFDIALTLLGLLSLVFAGIIYPRAFPSAALDLTLSRAQIAEQARSYMLQQGYDLEGYRSVVVLVEDSMASIYLQRTLGIPGTNALVREQHLPIWTWYVRWFRPLQKEEFRLYLQPDGDAAGLVHTLLETAPGASVTQDEARTLAQTYLTADRGWTMGDWQEVAASTQAQPGGRVDHHLEWTRKAWHVGQSELRLSVTIQGDRVGQYDYWLKAPEAFQRNFSEQRSRAGFIANISLNLGLGLFGLAVLVYFYLGHRRGIFPWYEGAIAGGAVAGVALLNSLNALPLSKLYYGTTSDYGIFWVSQVLNALIEAGYVAAGVAVLWAGGRYLARRVWPQQDKLLPREGNRWLALGRSTWRGLMLAAVDGGYVVLFYLLAEKVFGGWSPAEVPDVNLYATPLPFLAPLANGVFPAVSEEFAARLVGIAIILLLTRRTWLALLIPGLLWSFAHLTYVVDPIYLRGIELIIPAIYYGYMFLRFDLTTTIMAHLSFNALITATPLLRSSEPYFFANGVLLILLLLAPLLPAALYLLRRRLKRTPPEPSPILRRADIHDASALANLISDVEWPAYLEEDRAAVYAVFSQDQAVGVAAGRVVGSAAGETTDDRYAEPLERPRFGPGAGDVRQDNDPLAPARMGIIEHLYVAPKWRRAYWGSRLMRALHKELVDKGAQAFRVAVPAQEWTLARFWDSLGWGPLTSTYGFPAPRQRWPHPKTPPASRREPPPRSE